MYISYKIYFTFVTLTCLYGMEWNAVYLFTMMVTNMYYTAGEYLFHRLAFHNSSLSPSLSKAHSKHHAEPTNERRLFIPILVTLLNDMLFICINYWLDMNIWYFISASHLSYLLFELSHYASHLPISFFPLPKRLIAFHHHHHHNDAVNYGFTTPAWDLLCGTSSTFSLYHYPFCYFPISILSFLSIHEIVVVSNIIYLYPAYQAYKLSFPLIGFYYILTGATSIHYHIHPHVKWTRVLDYFVATGYFLISLYYYATYSMAWEPVMWCFVSLLVFCLDRNKYTHIIWHLLTAIGVGKMIQ